jgi:hypothetical protein
LDLLLLRKDYTLIEMLGRHCNFFARFDDSIIVVMQGWTGIFDV